MKIKPIYLFDENDAVKIEKLLTDKENEEIYQTFGLFKDVQAVILWKSRKKIILRTGENKLAISERAAEKILASLL